MRRILKATTAIVTSISLILPQFAMAEGQDNSAELLLQKKLHEESKHKEDKPAPKEQAEPKPEKHQPKPKAEQPAPEKQAAPDREPKPKQRDAQPEPQAEKPAARQAEDQPKRDAQPAPKHPAREDKPAAAERSDKAKPKPEAQAEKPAPAVKPDRADAQDDSANAPKPRHHEQKAQDGDQPDARDAGRAAPAAGDAQPTPKPEAARGEPKSPRAAPPDAAELKREMEQRERPDAAPRPDDTAPPRAQGDDADAKAKDAMRARIEQGKPLGKPDPDQADAKPQRKPDPDQADAKPLGKPDPDQADAKPLGKPDDPAQADAKPRQPDTAQANGDQPAKPAPRLTADELQQELKRNKGEANLPAPEASAKDSDLAKRAAAAVAIPAAALAAGDAKAEVSERKITKDDLRRSDQDFRNAIRDNGPAVADDNGPQRQDLQREMRELEQQRAQLQRERRDNDRDADWRALERRQRELAQQQQDLDRREHDLERREARDNDDDHGSDIAKLLLAGAAGFAVGKLMSGGRQVALNTGDRAVLTLPDGSQQIVRDDNALLYQPGSNVQTENFADGSSRTTVLREDGSRVVTIRDADMNILRRTLIRPDGRETRLIDDTQVRPVQVSTLPPPQQVRYTDRPWNESDLRNALLSESRVDRRFTLTQIRDIPEVRALVAPVNVPEITFDTGSAALSSNQAEQLATLGKVIRDAIDRNPNEIFMIEGYTDAVGSAAANLALSDRRAESVALALTEYFQVPPENMVVQGYGKQFMLVPSDGPQRDNRRVAVRRITDLLEQNS